MSLPIQVSYFTIFYLEFKTKESVGPIQLLLLVFSLWCYLSYIVLLNDLCDRKLDAAVGKATIERGHGLSISQLVIILVLLVSVSSSVIFFELRGSNIFDLLWLTSYVVGTIYSLPPVNLKKRGFLGFLADSLIEKPLPILIIFSFFNYYGFEIILFPFIGELLDSVFKHQAHDYDIDVKEGARTFAVSLGKSVSNSSVKYLFNPLDSLMVLLAYLLVIWQIPQVREVTSLFLLAIILGITILLLKSRSSIFKPGMLSWIDPRLEDPPYIFFFNCAFELLLLPILGIGLVIQNPSYLPILILSIISIVPLWLFTVFVGLVGTRKAFSVSK